MELDESRAIGARIAEARRHAGLTQRELADRLEVTVRTVQNYEAGVAVPYRYLRMIETLGRKRPGWILDGGDDAGLLAIIASLHTAMDRHQELMQKHLDEMRRHTTRLREQRRLNAERRASSK
jgi:transcriptional regulator with XRE-family HTH domain